MKVFLGTNLLVGAVATRGLCADMMRAVLFSHQLVISRPLLNELRRILTEKIGLPEDVIDDFFDLLRQDAICSIAEETRNIDFSDLDDIPILSSALNGGVMILSQATRPCSNSASFRKWIFFRRVCSGRN